MNIGYVVLVNGEDKKIGLMDIRKAHEGAGVLHRAISVLLYRENNGKTELLLQQRSQEKPLWPLFWSNTICTHPRDGESTKDCAVRRLQEEMGISVTTHGLVFIFKLTYQAKYNEELGEYERDSVFVGKWDGVVTCNPKEAADYRWIGREDLAEEMEKTPDIYTPWFHLLMKNDKIQKVLKGGD